MARIGLVFGKIKYLIVGILDLIRYLCCRSRSRKKSASDFAPLTSIGVVARDDSLLINNDDINFVISDSCNFNQPRNVQDYIAQYRQQKCKQLTSEPTEETPADFFQDMEPKIVRQQRVVLQTNEEPTGVTGSSRLSFSPEIQASELSPWEEMESTGNWDIGEETTGELLKEKRRVERERKLVENMKKRIDKDRNRMAAKIS